MVEASRGAAAEVAETTVVEKQPHRLESKWTFWFDNQSKSKNGAAWDLPFVWPSLSKQSNNSGGILYDEVTRPSKLPDNADFHLFKAGVEPKWEDPECVNGGKWTAVSSKKAALDTLWLETLMALIVEQFEEADEICGVVVSVRQRQDKIALWTKNAANEAVQMSIGRKWKEVLDVTDKISYSFHDDSKRERSAKSRYSF